MGKELSGDKASRAFVNACSKGDAAKVELLLHNGVDVESRDQYGLTGLILAGRRGHIEIAKVLLANGAQIDVVDLRGRTALFHAVTYKRYDFVRYLAEHGANLNVVDVHGWTPLDFSACSHNVKMAAILEDLGGKRSDTLK